MSSRLAQILDIADQAETPRAIPSSPLPFQALASLRDQPPSSTPSPSPLDGPLAGRRSGLPGRPPWDLAGAGRPSSCRRVRTAAWGAQASFLLSICGEAAA